MTNKWNAAEIKNYSNAFAKVVSEEFFKTKESISGAEIINLTEVKQLNLFILKELYDKWQAEVLNLKSPYFDYSVPEVKKAMEDFMNILSRYILVKKEHFEQILEKAAKATLELYTEPKCYFTEILRNLPDFKLDENWLKSNGKFFKDYNWVLRELLNKLNGVNFIYANEAIDALNEIFEGEKIEDHSSEIKDIVKISGLNKVVETPAQNYQSFFDSIEEYKMSNRPSKAVEAVVPETVIVHEPVKIPEPEPEIFEMKMEPVPFKQEPEYENRTTVNSKIEENVTLNDAMTKENVSNSVSDFHQKRKIESIKGNISLNQKFLFINNLFGNSSETFNAAVDELELCNNFSEAKDQMLKKYMPKFKWDLNSAEAEEFFDLLKRRFN